MQRFLPVEEAILGVSHQHIDVNFIRAEPNIIMMFYPTNHACEHAMIDACYVLLPGVARGAFPCANRPGTLISENGLLLAKFTSCHITDMEPIFTRESVSYDDAGEPGFAPRVGSCRYTAAQHYIWDVPLCAAGSMH